MAKKDKEKTPAILMQLGMPHSYETIKEIKEKKTSTTGKTSSTSKKSSSGGTSSTGKTKSTSETPILDAASRLSVKDKESRATYSSAPKSTKKHTDYNTETKNAYTSAKNKIFSKTTSNLTESQRKARIKKIDSELRQLNTTLNGLGRASGYNANKDWYKTKSEETKKRITELSEEKKSLEKISTLSKITITSNLTEKERKARIREIETELRQLNDRVQGLGSASGYSKNKEWYRTESEKAKKRIAELSEEKKSLKRVGTFTASELKQFEIDDAKARKAALPTYNPTARVMPSDAEAHKKNIEAHSAIDKEIDTLERQKGLYDDISEFGNVVNEDDFDGQWRANYRSNELSREADKAMSEYIRNPTEENKLIAYAYDALAKEYAKNNKKALDDENVKASWLTKSLAGYLPQLRDQIAPELIGGGIGLVLGGNVGASIGAGLATYAQSYEVIQGSVYRTLLESGVDEQTALKLAQDEAVISSLIEGGETALGWLVSGGLGALNAIGAAARTSVAKGSTNAAVKFVAGLGGKAVDRAAKKAAKAVTRPLWKTGLRVAGGIVGNGLTEYGEEFTQGAVSVANREQAYATVEQEIGQYGEGNIDLYNRPVYKNADGSISTVDSVTFKIDNKYVVLPTIVRDENGNAIRLESDEEILAYFGETGEYLGEFDTLEEANGYATKLHTAQAYIHSDQHAGGEGNLWKGGYNVVKSALSGDNPELFAELHEQGVEGFKIGVMMGGSQTIANNVVAHYANAKTVKNQNEIADTIIGDEESLNALIEEGKASGAGTVSAKIATEIETARADGKAVTRNQVKQLIESNEVYIKAEEQTAPDTLEQAARDVVESRNKKSGIALLEARKRGEVTPQMLETLTQHNVPITNAEAKIATGFGDRGAELVANNANVEGATFSQTLAEVEPSYLAGFNHPDLDIKKVAHTFDTQAQEDAYTAGQIDGKMQSLEAEAKAKNARVFGNESGVVRDEHSVQYTPDQLQMADTIGKDLGSQVSFEERLIANMQTKAEANAWHQDGEIKRSNTSDNEFIADIMEESLHRVMQINTEAAQLLMREAYDFAVERERSRGVDEGFLFNEEKALHDRAGVTLNTRGYMEEVSVGVLSTELFRNEKEWLRWKERLDANPELRTAWQKFMDVVSQIIEKLRRLLAEGSFSKETREKVNKDIADLNRLKDLYGEAYKATRNAVAERRQEVQSGNSQKNTDSEGGVQFSLKNKNKKSLLTFESRSDKIDYRADNADFIFSRKPLSESEKVAMLQDIYSNNPQIQATIEQINRYTEEHDTSLIDTDERNEFRLDKAKEYYDIFGAKNKDRKAVIIIGPPAAGKSTIANQFQKEFGAIILDSDIVKEGDEKAGFKGIPEYNGGIGVSAVHEESGQITHEVFSEYILPNGDNVVIPKLGKKSSIIIETINKLRDNEYEITLVLNDLPIEKAIQRSISRYNATGRLVRPEIILDCGYSPVETYKEIKEKELCDGYEIYSNDVNFGQQPTLIERKQVNPRETPGANSFRKERVSEMDRGRGRNKPRNGENKEGNGSIQKKASGEVPLTEDDSQSPESVKNNFSLKDSQDNAYKTVENSNTNSTENLEIESNKEYNGNISYSLYTDEVIFSSRYNAITQSKNTQELYNRAKKGDSEAAYELLSQLLKEDNINKIKSFGDDIYLIPVVGAEGTSTNILPQIIAEHISVETEQNIFNGIYKENSSNSRAITIWDRMKENYPSFTLDENGNITSSIAGKNFVLIDDNSTTGRTFVGLKNFIEENGGKAVGYYALTTGQDQSEKIITTDGTWDKLLNLGLDKVKDFAEKEGIKREISKHGLTERETQELIKQFERKNVDSRRGYEDVARSERSWGEIQGVYAGEKENGSTDGGLSKTKSYSLKWHPDLSKNDLIELMDEIKYDIRSSKNAITDEANWLFTDIGGKDVFAIYSTDDYKDPTLLYESKGKKAEQERNILLNVLEETKNGVGVDRQSATINEVSGGSWMQKVNGVKNSIGGMHTRNGSSGNVAVLQGKSSTYGSPAFRNVIKNLVEISSRGQRGRGVRDGVNYSLKGGISGMELLDTIEKVQKGKKGAAEKLAKYVESGMIRTKTYDELIEKYGAIPSGEKPHRNIQVPRKTGKNKKVSQTVRTILEAKATPDEAVPTIEKMVEDGVFSYDVYTDKQAISDAESYIKEYGWDESIDDWFDAVEKGEVSKQITAMGWALYNNAANIAATTTSETERTTAIKTSLKILDAMVKHQRSAAQALQATRILKSLSPETQLYGVQKSVSALQNELSEKYGDKAPDLQIDAELAEQFITAETAEERAEIEKEIYKDIGRQMPSRFIDKWNAWRYLAMLGNPRTHIRNIVGNAGFAPAVAAKDLTATAIESIVNRVSTKKIVRGKALVTGSKADRALLKAAWGDYGNVAELISNGGKYNDRAMANQHIEEGRQIFNVKPLEWARKKNSTLLEVEDMWFAQPHYAYALAQYCKANNITAEQIKKGKAIAPAREYAIKEAQKATYRDTNAFSQLVSEWGRSNQSEKNVVKKAFSTVVEGILPFRKTPANILVRGVEYSPLGLIKGLSYDLYKVSKGDLSASEAIDNISAGLTGTGLLAFGVFLAAQGLVRGHGGDDKEEKEFEKLMGHQAYALELPDGQSITLDWLAPEALPFFVGVNLWEATNGSDEEANLSTILQAVSNISEPMLEMSCLQGLNDLFEGIGYASSNDTSGLVSVISSAATSYLMQGIPTVSGQAERTGEAYRMSTYTEKNDFLTGDMQYTLGKASAKIPLWDYHQIPYIDAWGRKEASGAALKRGLNNFLNPAYTSTVETSKIEKELLRLYESTGEGGVFPSRADKYFTVDGVRKDLTADEYVKYATLKGQKSYKLVSDLVKSKAYKALDDEEKVKAIDEAYDYANQKAKQAISNYKPETWVGKADEFGANVGSYISFKANVNGTKENNGGKISKQEVVDIILDMAQNDSDTWKMYLSMYDSTSDMYAYNKGIGGETYMYFLESLNDVDMPTKSGKYGTYTQAEATSAIKRLDGLSRQEKAALWQSVNTTWKRNPFR